MFKIEYYVRYRDIIATCLNMMNSVLQTAVTNIRTTFQQRYRLNMMFGGVSCLICDINMLINSVQYIVVGIFYFV